MRYRLNDSVSVLSGVGSVLARQLEAQGIRTVGELIITRPIRYIDGTRITSVSSTEVGELQTLLGVFDKIKVRYIDRRKSIVDTKLFDASGSIRVRWFNQPYLAKQLREGSEVRLLGKVSEYKGLRYLESPLVVRGSLVMPRYLQVAGMASGRIRNLIREALSGIEFPEIGDTVLRERMALRGLGEIFTMLHEPQSAAEYEDAVSQLSKVEGLSFFSNLHVNRKTLPASVRLKAEIDAYRDEVVKTLPFTLTDDQTQALNDMTNRMKESISMVRLLNGDVGSGKTVVAAVLAACVSKMGFKVAFLAPTTVLATQHAATCRNLLEPLGISVALWTGSSKSHHGSIADVVVGTHALLSGTLKIEPLGLVIVDEQQRFGVRQRALLSAHGETSPHVLSMTATPIPRTLALSLLAGTEVSFLRQRPQRDYQIATKVVRSASDKKQLADCLEREIAAGRQVYVVCGLIELTEDGDTQAMPRRRVVDEFVRIRDKYPQFRVGMVHGKMSSKEKQGALDTFAGGDLDILVSTTVIEVGVDVPNATVMVIEDAEFFGLSQLHQLRGRVGRGSTSGWCFLIPSHAHGGKGKLEAFSQLRDGFEVAALDLENRGPGELSGLMQSGFNGFSFLDIRDTKELEAIREALDSYLARGGSVSSLEELPFSRRIFGE